MASHPDPLVALRRHASSAPWRARELIELVDRLLGPLRPVDDRPLTGRTLHYYVASRVVRTPSGRGAGTGWGYPHLIELLAARIARAAGDSLQVIAARRDERGLEALERQVADSLGPAAAEWTDSTPVDDSGDIPVAWRDHVITPSVVLRLAATHPLHDDPRRLGVLLDGLAREVDL